MKVNVFDLVNMNEEAIWNIPPVKHEVIFSDGSSHIVSHKKIHISWYYWRLFREFPGAPILKKHILTGEFMGNTHTKIGVRIFWDVYNGAVNKYKNIIWDMSRVFYEITNSIYNITCTRLSEYVTTASLYDLVEIYNEPSIIESKRKYIESVEKCKYDEKGTVAAIAEAHQIVKDLLYTRPEYLKHNGIKKLCNARVVNQGQIIQLIGPRGYLNDIDNRVFKYPINRGYAEGFKALYETAIESRSASRALYMVEDPLEQSEYFNREMQLLCSRVHSVIGEDCGCAITSSWLVDKGDGQLLKGKYHMVDGVPELIWDSIDHLIDKTIQLRSITGCGNHDTQTVCKTCLGWSEIVIPPNTNVGYAIATILCAIISQLMLSTKHYESSNASQSFELTDRHSMWIRTCNTDKGHVLLQKNVIRKNPIIRISVDDVKHLNNILSADIEDIAYFRISNVTAFAIAPGSLDGVPTGPFEELKTIISGKGIFISTEVLEYIKENGWKSNSKYIEFQLINWHIEDPIFRTPRLADNIYLFLKEVKGFLIPSKSSEVNITQFTNRGQALQELVNILRKRMNFNLPQAEILIRSCMTVNGSGNNYKLPHTSDPIEFMNARDCLTNSSLTTLLAYEVQTNVILDTEWYKDNKRAKHMLDELLETT